MYLLLHWAQAASEARVTGEPHSITYVDFLTVTLTAMCVLLAALGFIVAIVAVIGYRDIKAASAKVAKAATEAALEAKLQEYPNSTEIHRRFAAIDRYMNELVRKEALLAQIQSASSPVSNASNRVENEAATKPRRYPKRGD